MILSFLLSISKTSAVSFAGSSSTINRSFRSGITRLTSAREAFVSDWEMPEAWHKKVSAITIKYLRLLIRMAFLFDVEFDYYLNINNSYTVALRNGNLNGRVDRTAPVQYRTVSRSNESQNIIAQVRPNWHIH